MITHYLFGGLVLATWLVCCGCIGLKEAVLTIFFWPLVMIYAIIETIGEKRDDQD